jgi:hypothetical protein
MILPFYNGAPPSESTPKQLKQLYLQFFILLHLTA